MRIAAANPPLRPSVRRILLLSECSLRNPTFKNVLPQLGRKYTAAGYDVTVAAPLSPNSFTTPRETFRYRTRWGAVECIGGRTPRASAAAARNIGDQAVALLNRADAAHLHLIGSYTAVLERLADALRHLPIPVLISFHDYGNPIIERTPEHLQGLAELLRNRRVTVLSSYGREKILCDFPFLRKSLHVVPEGIDVSEKADSGARGGFVLCPAWLSYYKGVDILLMAWARLAPKPLRLVFTGREHRRSHLRGMARRLGLGDACEFMGQVSHARMLDLMRKSEFVVLPSRHEFFGIAALEAMALGKAVIASRTGFADFIKDGVSGLLIPPGNLPLLERAISRLIRDRILRDRLGCNAVIASVPYSWDAIAERYMRLISGIHPV